MSLRPIEATGAPRLACSARVTSSSYARGQPEQSVLYKVLQSHLATFLATAAAHDDTTAVPRFVEKELRGFLDCGVVARGLIRLHCTECARDHVIGLSCKGRGFCPRCGGRRMTETAAHLVDHVIPRVPVRQWVLTVPHRFRYRIGYDHGLCKRFLRALGRELQTYYRNKTQHPDGQKRQRDVQERVRAARRRRLPPDSRACP